MPCHCHDHECECLEEHEHEHLHSSKKELFVLLIKLGVSVLFLLLGMFLKFDYSWINIIFYAKVSIITYPVVLTALDNTPIKAVSIPSGTKNPFHVSHL